MKQFFKGAVALLIVAAVVAVAAHFAYMRYRQGMVEAALAQGRHFVLPERQPKRAPSSPGPIARLRPLPWSSPMHDRRFDDAVAGAKEAYRKGDYDRAIILNTEALQHRPSADLVWLLLTRRAECYLRKGDPDKALADYDEAARLAGLSGQPCVGRALALRLKGRRDEAMNDFDAAIASDPDDPWIYSKRAAVFAEDGNLEAALADYTKAVELDPRDTSARLAAAGIYLRRQQNEKAIAQASIVQKIDPGSALAYVLRAKAFAQLGMKSRAVDDLDAIHKLTTYDKAAALNEVAWCRATDRLDSLRDGKKAVSEATEACELNRWKNWSYIDTLAAAYAEAGDFDQAAEYEQQAMQIAATKGTNTDQQHERLELYQQRKPFRQGPNSRR